ncbi:hypothetical protein GA0116948_101603 [Chitinophaga costaii]|uniref:Uncharacterized protein n=1 Tax=Chitinophaga costaii TaxID=1335309 RepID=A0A1C3ZY25_9BACT|nr:hypothetical protein [Chitinophaga costaii]SCB87243.1 hypothetical protein GA0116948_101603 [Chitinophaga costaii]
MEAITFSRQQLYDLVWSDSLLSLSKKYNISDNGLRKACKRMGIPLPDMGYWNKIKAGKKVAVKPLSKEHKGDQQIRLSLRISGENITEGGLSPQLSLQKEIESDSGLNLEVGSVLINPDPLIIRAEKALLQRSKQSKTNDLLYAGSENLDIRVSQNFINRALCIMDTFIKVMRHRGHDFVIERGDSYLLIAEEKMKMTLRETQTKVVVKDRWERTEYHPNGILSFRFDRYINSASCTDGKVLIEHQLSKLIAKLELLGERFKIERAEQKRWHDKFEEERRIKKEIADRKKTEFSLFRQLLKDSRRWKDAAILREYIDQIERSTMAEGNITEEMTVWLEWARKKADWFDPLVNSTDEWLEDVDPNSLMTQNNMNNSANNYNYNNDYQTGKHDWPLVPWYIKNRQ